MKKAMAANDWLVADKIKAQTVRNILSEEAAEKLPGQVDMFSAGIEFKENTNGKEEKK